MVLAISLDGKIAIKKGDNTQLGKKGDRKVLENALAWADGALMGGETLRVHKSTCLIHEDKLLTKRINEGRKAQPIAVIISKQKKYSLEWKFFKQPIERWLISTENNSNIITPIPGYHEIINFEESWDKTLVKLQDKGIEKLVVLGGSKLIGSLLVEDKVNELQFTLIPKIIGGNCSWIPWDLKNMPKQFLNDCWSLNQTEILGGNEIMLSYLRNKNNF